MENQISFVENYCQVLARLSKIKDITTYDDPIAFIERSLLNTTIWRLAPNLCYINPTNEIHYYSLSEVGCHFRTVLIFGDVKGKTIIDRKIERLLFDNDFNKSELKHHFKLNELIMSICFYLDGDFKIEIKRRFGMHFNYQKHPSNVIYRYRPLSTTAQMFKSSKQKDIDMTYWKSMLLVEMISQLQFGDINVSVKPDIKEINHLVKEVTDNVNDIVKGLPIAINEQLDDLSKGFLSSVRHGGAFTLGLLGIAYAFDYIFNDNRESKTKAMVICLLAGTLVGPEILSSITILIGSDKQSHLQFGDCPQYIKDGFKILLDCTPNVSMKSLKDYTYLISNFDRIKGGVVSIIQWILEQIDKICDFLLKKKVVPTSWYVSTETSEYILNFLERIEKFNNMLLSGKVPYTSKSYCILKDLIDECIVAKLEVSKHSGSGSVLEKCYNQLMEIKSSFGTTDSDVSGYRPEPASLLLRGSPGVNKSTLVEFIINRLYFEFKRNEADPNEFVNPKHDKHSKAKDVRIDDMSSFVFFRQSNNRYYDGYKQQDVVVFDEFGQTKDVAGDVENCYMELISAKNSIPLHCHMADIADKKNVYFHSKYILATTNVMEFQPVSIHDSLAVDRRWDIDVIVAPRPEFCIDTTCAYEDRKFDYSKISGDKDIPVVLKPEMFELRRRKRVGIGGRNVEIIAGYSLDQLYTDLVNKRKFLEQCYENNRNAAAKFAGEIDEDISYYLQDLDIEIDGLEYDYMLNIFEPTFGDINQIPESLVNVRKFMSLLTMEVGSLNCNYHDFLRRMTKILGPEFIISISHGNNFNHWLSRIIPEISIINEKNLCESLLAMENIFSPEKSKVIDIRNFISENKSYIGMGILLVSALSVYSYWNKQEKYDTLQSPTMVRPAQNVPQKSMEQIKATYSTLQMGRGIDPSGDDLLDSILRKNCYGFFVDGKQRGQILFIASNLCIMPSHFIQKLYRWVEDPTLDYTTDSIIDIKSARGYHEDFSHYKITIGELIHGVVLDDDLDDQEIVAVRFPERFPKHKNIIRFFKTKDQFKDVFNLVTLKIVFHGIKTTEINSQCSSAHKLNEHPLDWFGGVKRVKTVYHLNAPTTVGHCGAVCMELNPKAKNKIIGLHIAGNEKIMRAISTAITQEMLVRVFNKANVIPLVLDELEENSSMQMCSVLDNRFAFVNKVKPVNMNHKTTIIKSKMCGVFQEPTMLPAVLHPLWRLGKQVDVHANALSHYNKNTGVFINPTLVELIVDSEIDFYNNVSVHHVDSFILTDSEAIVGVVDEVDFSPISRKSSPGYPYVFAREGLRGKTYWFGEGEVYDLDRVASKEFIQEMHDYEQKLKCGVLPPFYFVDNLKDELRPLKKINELSTRNFSACSMSLTFLCKKYFGSFMIWMVKNRLHNGLTIGINPYSSEWDLLARMLLSKNIFVNAGDFKKFDTAHAPQLVCSMLRIVESFYVNSTPEEVLIRRLLWSTLYSSYHVFGDNLLNWQAGLCSGHPLTALFNSMYNRFVHKYCFYDLCGETTDLLWKFNKAVIVCPHGDDSLMTVDPYYSDDYNEMTLPNSMIKLGLVYTPENKDDSVMRLRTLGEVMYLKRSFLYNSEVGGYLAPMKLERVLEMPNWTKIDNSDVILRDKCDVIARELALHGEHIFNKYVPVLNDEYRKLFRSGMTMICYRNVLCIVLNSDVVSDISNLQMNILKDKNEEQALTTVGMGSQLKNITFLLSELQMDSDVSKQVSEPSSRDAVFNDDAAVINVAVPRSIGRNRGAADFMNGNTDLARFLGRPKVISSGNLASTDTATTFSTYDWSSLIINTYADKLKGVFLFKADLVLRLVVNANPYQQGLYLLAFCYTGGAASTENKGVNWIRAHRYSKVQIIQLPHVGLDIACDTEVTLTIPWRNAFNAFVPQPFGSGVVQNWGSPGVFFMYPYSKLNSNGGSTTAGYTLYAHYENCEFGAISFPQMAGNPRRKKVDMLTQEQEKKPVSAFLEAGAQVSGALASVPFLSSICAPLSWVLDASARAAKSWGFSAPNLVDEPHRVVRSYFPYMSVCDGTDAAEPLSLTKGNHVEFAPDTLGTDFDELSIDFLKQIPSHVTIFQWTTGNAKDVVLNTQNVAPYAGVVSTNDGLVTLNSYSPLAWMAQWFNYWRGSLIFTLKFVKTRFHSGRVLVVAEYYDESNFAPAVSTIANSEYCYRNIVDIRECNEIDIVVPWISNKAWEQTYAGPIAKLSFIVLDPLVAPGIVATTIDVIVELRGGEDFMFSSPTSCEIIPCVPSALQMDGNPCVLAVETIGKSQIKEHNMEMCSITQGEAIVSMRQLLKRHMPLLADDFVSVTTSRYVVPPFASYIYTSNATVVAGTNQTVTRDLYSHCSNIFALSRGGVRINAIPVATNTTQTLYFALDHVNYGAGNLSSMVTGQVGSVDALMFKTVGLGLSFMAYTAPNAGVFVPQNTNLLCRINARNIMTSTEALKYTAQEADPAQLILQQQGGSASTVYFLRAGADDIGFGCFVSIPPFYTDASPA